MRLVTAVLLLVLAPVLALGQVPDPSQPDAFMEALVKAITTGQWRFVAILVAVGVVYGLRQLATRIPGKLGVFFGTARGGALLALLGGVVTTLAGVFAGGGPITLAVVINGVILGVAAAGGWNIVRRLFWGDSAPAAYPEKKS